MKNKDVVVGMTEEEALALGEKMGFTVRVVERDEVQFILTAECQPDRRNIVVVQGLVTQVTRG